MKISEIINFEIMAQDGYVATPHGAVHFIRIIPPNLSIMTAGEKDAQIEKFESLLDAAAIPFTIFIMDKIEDLSANKAFYSNMSEDYRLFTGAIIESMEMIESDNSVVQRAFYLVTMTRELEDFILFKNLVSDCFTSSYQVKAQELETVLRNFILREFVPYDIYAPELQTANQAQNEQKKKGRSPVPGKNNLFDSSLTKRLTPQRMQFTPNHIIENDYLRKVIIIKNFPTNIDIRCFMSKLAQIKNTTISMRLEEMSEGHGARLVDNQMRNVAAKGYDRRVTQQVEASVEADAITSFYRNLRSNNSKLYNINIYIEVYAEDEKELRKKLEKVKSRLIAYGITVDYLTREQKEGFFGVYPLEKDLLKNSCNNMPSPTIAGMFPFSHSSRNDHEGMPLGSTDDGGHMFLDFWIRDSDITNGNYTIVGESGQGKSHLQKKILSFQMLRETSCFSLDPDNEYTDLFESMGGTSINCAGGEIKINPLELRRMSNSSVENIDEADEELEAFRHRSVFFQHLSWLKDFFHVLFPDVTYKELNALMILTQDMYKKYGIVEETDISELLPTQYPTFTSLYKFTEGVLQGNEKVKYDMISPDMLKNLLLLLKDTYDGSLGHLLNGHTNIRNSRLINFNIQQLLIGSEDRTQAVLFNIMTYIWNRISLRLEYILFNVDELHTVIGSKNSIVAKYLKDFMKRARKYNAIIGTATQRLSDYFANPDMANITSTLLNAPMFKFVFYPGDTDLEATQTMLKLSDGEIGCIKTPKKGRCLLKAGSQKYLMHVGLLPYEMSLFGSGGGR